MAKRLELSGQRFNRLLITHFVGIAKGNKTLWEAKCDCGNVTVVYGYHLTNGDTQSCGCKHIKHSLSKSRFYMTYYDMLKRCYNSNQKFYRHYGGRGIKVCDRWLGESGFINFKEDMYDSYLEHIKEFGEDNTSIDRILVNGNYSLLNCRWATKKIQVRNRRNSINSVDYDEHKKWGDRLSIFLSSSVRKVEQDLPLFETRIGISLSKFKKYIESQFKDGMTWHNYGRGKGKWSLDHIKPKYKFDLSVEDARKRCFHYTNLRPLWNIKNTCKIR